MPVVGECQIFFFPFGKLRNEIFSPEHDTNKDTSFIIGEMVVTAAAAPLAEIRDEKNPRRSICQVLGADSVGVIHLMLTMQLVYST